MEPRANTCGPYPSGLCLTCFDSLTQSCAFAPFPEPRPVEHERVQNAPQHPNVHLLGNGEPRLGRLLCTLPSTRNKKQTAVFGQHLRCWTWPKSVAGRCSVDLTEELSKQTSGWNASRENTRTWWCCAGGSCPVRIWSCLCFGFPVRFDSYLHLGFRLFLCLPFVFLRKPSQPGTIYGSRLQVEVHHLGRPW